MDLTDREGSPPIVGAKSTLLGTAPVFPAATSPAQYDTAYVYTGATTEFPLPLPVATETSITSTPAGDRRYPMLWEFLKKVVDPRDLETVYCVLESNRCSLEVPSMARAMFCHEGIYTLSTARCFG